MPRAFKQDLVSLQSFKSTEEIQVRLIPHFIPFGYRSDTVVTDTTWSNARQLTGSIVKNKRSNVACSFPGIQSINYSLTLVIAPVTQLF